MDYIIIFTAFIVYIIVATWLKSQGTTSECTSTPTYTPTNYDLSGKDKVNNQFMSAKDKKAYLSSYKWQLLRRQALRLADHKCTSCGSVEHLQCHHTSYVNLSEGVPDELFNVVVLCDHCHQRQHDHYGYRRGTQYLPIM